MEQKSDQPRKKYRWIFLVVLVLSIIFSCRLFPPVPPHIQLPAEAITHEPLFDNFYITNTMIATLIADILLVAIALAIHNAIRKGVTVPTGISGAIAAIVEMLYNMTESTAGKYARKIFPYFATIFLLVLFVNWMELIPGVDTIGTLEKEEHGYPIEKVLPNVYTVVRPDEGESKGEEHGGEGLFTLIPFVRVASTDLNFTIAIALVSVVMTQVIGLQALGPSYLRKYMDTSAFITAWRSPRFGNPLGFLNSLIDIFVSILETVAEFSKIISFSFRLFGNIFAGSVMLFIIGSLVPVLVPSFLLMLEMFVGAIQAFVFAMLTMVFMSMATHAHGDHEHEHEEQHAELEAEGVPSAG